MPAIGLNGQPAPIVSHLVGAADPTSKLKALQVDVSGNLLTTATATIAGPVTVNQGTGGASAWKVDGSAVTQPVSAASLPLPAGASTEATLGTRLADATFTGRINTQGQKTMAASTPVVIASDQSAIPISGTVTANLGTVDGLLLDSTFTGRVNTQGQKTMAASTPVVLASDQSAVSISGTITANQGGAPWSDNLTQVAGTALLTGNGVTGAGSPRVTIASDNTAFSVNANAGTNLNTSALLTNATFTGRINVQGQTTMSASTPVVIASDQSTLNVRQARAATGTVTRVATSAVSVTLLASNANRLGGSVFNESTQILYILNSTGGTASATNYTVQVFPSSYFEIPFSWTGDLVGIWVSDDTSAAQVTEYTA